MNAETCILISDLLITYSGYPLLCSIFIDIALQTLVAQHSGIGL